MAFGACLEASHSCNAKSRKQHRHPLCHSRHDVCQDCPECHLFHVSASVKIRPRFSSSLEGAPNIPRQGNPISYSYVLISIITPHIVCIILYQSINQVHIITILETNYFKFNPVRIPLFLQAYNIARHPG